ncbi:MAG: hypothetical protein OSA51_09280 [Octadecabacter sp.]|nr:hypothetical protein [Octadecabacter sp.]
MLVAPIKRHFFTVAANVCDFITKRTSSATCDSANESVAHQRVCDDESSCRTHKALLKIVIETDRKQRASGGGEKMIVEYWLLLFFLIFLSRKKPALLALNSSVFSSNLITERKAAQRLQKKGISLT